MQFKFILLRIAAFYVDMILINIVTALAYRLLTLSDLIKSCLPYTVTLLMIFIVYFLLIEKLFMFSVGKKLCGLKVISESDTMTWKQAIIRSASRIIPFESLFYFTGSHGLTYHDKVSKTKVIRVKNKQTS